MEEEKNNKYKKETSCLFYNFKINKKATPILTNIDDKKKKISDIYSNIDNYYGKKILTENDDFSKDSYGYYRHIFSKFLVSKLNKVVKNETNKNKNQKNKSKTFFHLSDKIHFGTFLNTSVNLEGNKSIHKIDFIKSQLSKSKNFSFYKDPKNMKFNKLPKDLYLSKEDSLKIKNLISIRLLPKKDNNIDKSLIKFSYDNGIYDKTNIKDNFEKIKNSKIIFINKKKLNKNNKNKDKQNSLSNLTESYNLNNIIDEKNVQKKLIKKKYLSESNLTEINNTNNNIHSKNNNIYNKTEYNNFTPNKKNYILSQLEQEIQNFSKLKTPKKDIKKCVKLYKHKSETKLREIDKLINKANLKADSKIIVNDLKIYGNTKKKKAFQKIKYADLKKRIRLLSIVEKLKNIKRLAPMTLLNQIYEEYSKKSKEVILNDPNQKYIENLYKSNEEGKLIKQKIDDKNYIINKIISKNRHEGNQLKNKYKQFDLVIDKINEENKAPINNQIDNQDFFSFF